MTISCKFINNVGNNATNNVVGVVTKGIVGFSIYTTTVYVSNVGDFIWWRSQGVVEIRKQQIAVILCQR